MAKNDYKTIDELLLLIDEEPNREAFQKMLASNKTSWYQARGSNANHQAWPGGYIHHIEETMNIAILLYEPLNQARQLPFSLSDALTVLYLHDLEKPSKYDFYKGDYIIKSEMRDRDYVKNFVEQRIEFYKILINFDHRIALDTIEGEIGTWSPKKRTMNSLGSFCHMCDNWSARGWHDYPLNQNDPWKHK